MKQKQAEEAADVLRAIAHPTRLRILDELRRSPRCVGSIEQILPVSQVNVSQHLTVLRKAKLVNFVQEGTLRCYYLAQPELVEKLLEALGKKRRAFTRAREDVRREREEKALCPGHGSR